MKSDSTRRQLVAGILAMGFFLIITGCAANVHRGNPPPQASSDQALANANPQAPDAARCKQSIDEISKYCKEASGSSRCNDAKSRSRQYCMKQ
jgi:hypothetical protein